MTRWSYDRIKAGINSINDEQVRFRARLEHLEKEWLPLQAAAFLGEIPDDKVFENSSERAALRTFLDNAPFTIRGLQAREKAPAARHAKALNVLRRHEAGHAFEKARIEMREGYIRNLEDEILELSGTAGKSQGEIERIIDKAKVAAEGRTMAKRQRTPFGKEPQGARTPKRHEHEKHYGSNQGKNQCLRKGTGDSQTRQRAGQKARTKHFFFGTVASPWTSMDAKCFRRGPAPGDRIKNPAKNISSGILRCSDQFVEFYLMQKKREKIPTEKDKNHCDPGT